MRGSSLIVKHFGKLSNSALLFLCFSPPEVESNFPAITYGRRQSASDRQSCETNAAPGSVQKKAVSWCPIPANLSRWFVGLVHWGTGSVPREVLAGLLTRWHLIPVLISFFYSWFFGLAYSGELGHGQGTRACICTGWVVGGSGEEPHQRWR